MLPLRSHWTALSVLATGLLLTGCSTYTQSVESTRNAKQAGRYDVAAQEAEKMIPKKADDKNAVIFNLEAGAAYRTLAISRAGQPVAPATPAPEAPVAVPAGAPAPAAPAAIPVDPLRDYKLSVGFLAAADDRIDYYDEQAKHSISAGLSTALLNPGETPYRGHSYDKIMLSTYQGLNYLAMNDPERARACFNKAYRRQAEAVEANSKRIEKDKEKIEAAKSGKVTDEKGKKASQGADPEAAMKDPKAAAAMQNVNASLDARMQAYEAYVNPFTVFIDGLFMLTNASDRQEEERAAKELVRVASMVPDNAYLKEDAVLAEQLAAGTALQGKTTYVVFESGEAPHREELLIPVPIFLVSKETIYTQIPLSRLAFNDNYNPTLLVNGGGVQKPTALVCNMDGVIAQDFKNALPSMYIDAFICAATKALIEHEVNKQLDKNVGGWGSLVGKIGVMAFNMTTTRGDTRSWQTLPKVFSYARMATPEDNVITVSTADNQSKTIKLPDNKVNLVYVKQVGPGAALLVDTIKLR